MITSNSASIAYLLVRLSMGINMLGHGAARIPKLQTFCDGMVTNMSKGRLPGAMVKPFALILPFAEFSIGLLLIVGLFTYRTSIGGAILILLLLFGSSTIENWEAMGIQMIYAIFFYLLIVRIEDNTYSLDKKMNTK